LGDLIARDLRDLEAEWEATAESITAHKSASSRSLSSATEWGTTEAIFLSAEALDFLKIGNRALNLWEVYDFELRGKKIWFLLNSEEIKGQRWAPRARRCFLNSNLCDARKRCRNTLLCWVTVVVFRYLCCCLHLVNKFYNNFIFFNYLILVFNFLKWHGCLYTFIELWNSIRITKLRKWTIFEMEGSNSNQPQHMLAHCSPMK